MPVQDIILTVRGCKRCGGAHDKLSFRPLQRSEGGWTHYATCPGTGEPLMLRHDSSDALRLQPMTLRAPDDLDDLEAVLKLPSTTADERVAMALEVLAAKRKIPYTKGDAELLAQAGVAAPASR